MTDSTHRVPPNDQAAEAAVIGGILLNAEALDAVRDEVFTSANIEHHAAIVLDKAALRATADAAQLGGS